MRVEIHRLARRDFVHATAYYAKRSRRAVVDWVEEFEAGLRPIEGFPTGAREIEPNVRRLVLKKFPYSLIYALSPDVVVVIAVVHHRTAQEYWRGRHSVPG